MVLTEGGAEKKRRISEERISRGPARRKKKGRVRVREKKKHACAGGKGERSDLCCSELSTSLGGGNKPLAGGGDVLAREKAPLLGGGRS